jgi:hypothetical protein
MRAGGKPVGVSAVAVGDKRRGAAECCGNSCCVAQIVAQAYPDWKTVAARTEAVELKKRIDRGEDPVADIRAQPEAPSAKQLLVGLRDGAEEDAQYVFPGRGGEAHRVEIKDNWTDLCTAAEITTTETTKHENGKERTIVAPSA